jgi:tRNA A37 methylthiotransferase MiaB
MIVNEIEKNGTLIGYTDNMKQIVVPPTTGKAPLVKGIPLTLGDTIPVHITGAGEFKLQGKINEI